MIRMNKVLNKSDLWLFGQRLSIYILEMAPYNKNFTHILPTSDCFKGCIREGSMLDKIFGNDRFHNNVHDDQFFYELDERHWSWRPRIDLQRVIGICWHRYILFPFHTEKLTVLSRAYKESGFRSFIGCMFNSICHMPEFPTYCFFREQNTRVEMRLCFFVSFSMVNTEDLPQLLQRYGHSPELPLFQNGVITKINFLGFVDEQRSQQSIRNILIDFFRVLHNCVVNFIEFFASLQTLPH